MIVSYMSWLELFVAVAVGVCVCIVIVLLVDPLAGVCQYL